MLIAAIVTAALYSVSNVSLVSDADDEGDKL